MSSERDVKMHETQIMTVAILKPLPCPPLHKVIQSTSLRPQPPSSPQLQICQRIVRPHSRLLRGVGEIRKTYQLAASLS